MIGKERNSEFIQDNFKNKFGRFNHIINSLNYSNFNFLSRCGPKLIYGLTKLEVSHKFDYF